MSSSAIPEAGALPLHALVAGQLRRAIAAGEFAVGSALPTAKEFAQRTGTHENTVLRAYRALQSEGLVDLRRSRGATVLTRPDYTRLDALVDQLLDEAEAQGMSVGALLTHVLGRMAD